MKLLIRENCFSDDLNKLYTMWQVRTSTPNVPISQATLHTFKQYSRLIHYCHTPLLFLPSWRLQSAATRDHSITPSRSLPNDQFRITSDISTKDVSKWHKELCASMLSEYKQYLQILGFNPVAVESPQDS